LATDLDEERRRLETTLVEELVEGDLPFVEDLGLETPEEAMFESELTIAAR
jgi:hypothetical protein